MRDPEWTGRGKTVAQLIRELQSFENQGLEARISVDGGATSLPISLVVKLDGKFAVLENDQSSPTVLVHDQART